ncbi:IS3 family transposase [Leptospira interrogans]|uniref:IS3 family transposase n=1 Tax=Leptospira interrogans TaxID=173 RepID=UPI0009E47F40
MRYQTTIREAQYFLFDYIERYYNRKRMHSALDDLSPVEFRKKLLHNQVRFFLRTIYRSR